MKYPTSIYVLLDKSGEVFGAWHSVEELLRHYDTNEIVVENLEVAEYTFSHFGEVKTAFVPTTKPKKK